MAPPGSYPPRQTLLFCREPSVLLAPALASFAVANHRGSIMHRLLLLGVAMLAGLPTAPAMAQQKAAPLEFSRDNQVGWVGVGGGGPAFTAVPGRLPPVA